MGNAPSSSTNRRQSRGRTAAPAWNWDFSGDRPQMKPRPRAAPPRPLFKRQPSDDYNWWIGNPDPPRRRTPSAKRKT